MIDFFNEDFLLYIHIDIKSTISEDDLLMIKNANNVSFLSRKNNVNWGSHNILYTTLMLAEEALKNKNIDYIHLISGQDFPIKSCEDIQQIIQKNKGREFINTFKMPAPFWSDNGGLDRITYFQFYDLFNERKYFGRKIINFLVGMQKLLMIKRNIHTSTMDFYGGSSWWSLSYDCLKYVIDFTKSKPGYLKMFKHSFAADEIYFQTIIMNSSFKKNVVNNNLRYIDWEQRNGSRPAILDLSDYEKIVNTDNLFARKFQYPISGKLLEKIEWKICEENIPATPKPYFITSKGDLPYLQ